MKYGIITHYDVHNHGALLQLNGLKQVLNGLGIEANALQFDKNYDFMGKAMKAKYEISIKSIGIYLKFIADRGIKSTWFNYKKSKLLNGFRKEQQLIGAYYTECGELDGVVVGSDEVFALHTGPTPAFFGHALPSNKVFAYGGCFGPTTIEDIDKLHCRAFVASGLGNMCGLGMRDQNSINIAAELTGKKPELVCDPVILYGYEKEIANKSKPISEPYMVVYAYDNKFDDQAEVIKEYAHRKGLKIVSPGFIQKWADLNVNVDPIELLNWFKGAECVVTNTFHGCVMSIITGREMAVKMRGNANKLFNLMQEYKIDERVFGEDKSLDDVFASKVDWDVVNEQIKERRTASLNYLKRMIAL
ncbi:polysaccharide pyruvyl transferase family protein [Prevotella sp.]|uniref:polysaccharide pyruvyl transferase family protein n=1 Tax=Prevotella sp. TaxID=59823 RepID=UPI00307B8D13